jgi:hypothetical protein
MMLWVAGVFLMFGVNELAGVFLMLHAVFQMAGKATVP